MVFNSAMDARDEDHRFRSALERFAIGVLAVLLLSGLWQGYGAWLFGAADSHGP